MTASSRVLTVLAVSAGGFQGLGLLKCLRDEGRIRAVVADCHQDHVTRYFADACYRVPPVAERSAFTDALLEIAAREGARIVFPATAFELEVLAEHATRFEQAGVQVAVSSLPFVRLAGNKAHLYAWLAGQGLPVLAVVDPASRGRFPLIGKPAASWGGRGVVVARGARDLEELGPAVRRSLVWQELLEPADEYSVDFGVDFDGRRSRFGVRRRVRTSAGFAVVADDAEPEGVREVMEPLAAAMTAGGARGPLNVQLLLGQGGLVVSDVNARIGTSAVHWCGTDRNPVLFVCRSLEPALPAPPPVPERPRRMVRFLDELWLDRPGGAAHAAAIEAVVFDLDDTLLDHKAWILARLEALHGLAADVLPERAAFLMAALQALEEGRPSRLFDALAGRFGWEPSRTERLIASYRALAAPPGTALYRDVLPVLESLRRRGLRLALLTDNPPPSQRQKLAATGLADQFEALVFTREEGAEKPDPRGFAVMEARLGLPASALAMVGDNPHRDAAGALAAGWAAAYIVRRPDSLFRFEAESARRWLPRGERLRVIDGLRPLLWDLRSGAA